MFANSSEKFLNQVKVRFSLSNGRGGRPSSVNSGDAVDPVFISREITDTLAFGFEAKSFAKRNLINSTS